MHKKNECKKIGYYNIMNKKYNTFTIWKLCLSCQKSKIPAACFIMMCICCFPDNTPALPVSTFCSSFEGDKLISEQNSLKSVTMKLIWKKATLLFYLCTLGKRGRRRNEHRQLPCKQSLCAGSLKWNKGNQN